MTMYAPEAQVHRPHVDYLLVAVIGLAVALVALGSWVLFDRYAGGGGATQNATTLIDGANAAISSADADALASFYTPDAVISRDDGGVTAGTEAIRGLVPQTKLLDYEVWRVAPRMWFFKLGDTPPFDNAVMP